MVKVFLHGKHDTPIYSECVSLLKQKGVSIVERMDDADVAIAPLLTKKLTRDEINLPRYGTLIFHPSLLPRHRGRDAIKWAFKLGEVYSGATWFWADEGYDTGDICEMEVLAIREGELPREYYHRAVIPSAKRMLSFIVDDLSKGHVHRRPQIHSNASYEHPIAKAI